MGLLVEIQKRDVQNGDVARRALNLLALAGEVVEFLPIDLDGRVHGRDLLLRAAETLQGIPHLVQGHPPVRPLDDRASRVLSVGGKAQGKAGLVGLVLRGGVVGSLGRPAHKNRQDTGGHGVQRAAVADLARPEDTAQLGHHIMRGKALRLIKD